LDPLSRKWLQCTVSHAVLDWRGRGLRVMPSQCDQSGKPLSWHHRGLTISGILRVKQFLPSLLIWQFRQQNWKNLYTAVTDMWGRHLS
jgi:hypothetical protein